MIYAAVDVLYGDTEALAAGVLFDDIAGDRILEEFTQRISPIAPYESGAFYKRELPCIEILLASKTVDCIIVDGYVNLDDHPGLGWHVHQRFHVPVIGVAKTSFKGSTFAHAVSRHGTSPLFVTEIGVPNAADLILKMHGNFRSPTLLKRVDTLTRGRG